jgi:hypothetical protein
LEERAVEWRKKERERHLLMEQKVLLMPPWLVSVPSTHPPLSLVLVLDLDLVVVLGPDLDLVVVLGPDLGMGMVLRLDLEVDMDLRLLQQPTPRG